MIAGATRTQVHANAAEVWQYGGGRPAIDGPEGRRSVEIIQAIYKSAETGRSVALPLAGDPVLKARKEGMGK